MSWFAKKPEVPNVEEYVRLFNEGVSSYHSGDFERCLDLFYRAINVSERKITNLSPKIWLHIGLAEMQMYLRKRDQKHLTNAEGALLAARALDPNDLITLYAIGSCYVEQERDGEAEEYFLKYIRLKPDIDALLKLGGIYHRAGRKQEAVNCWQRVLAIDSANRAAQENLANAGKYY